MQRPLGGETLQFMAALAMRVFVREKNFSFANLQSPFLIILCGPSKFVLHYERRKTLFSTVSFGTAISYTIDVVTCMLLY